MSNKRILVPLPHYGFDPTEVAVPWSQLSSRGHDIVFATPEGRQASPDSLMLTGKGLGVWKPVLRARQDAVEAYKAMACSDAFANPVAYGNIQGAGIGALLLPGGHDKGVREYLESQRLQQLVAEFFLAQKPVAAICHGVVLVARSRQLDNGKSVLFGRRTTALLKTQELLAYGLTRLWLKDYYLTYPEISVEDEVTEALECREHFQRGPSPLLRDDLEHLDRGFTVRDGNYLSARWPGDAYRFSHDFALMLESRHP